MLDVEEQLARLRQRIASIDHKYRKTAVPAPPPPPAARHTPGVLPPGRAVANELGEHYQVETAFASHHRHGSADVGALVELPHDLLDRLGAGEIAAVPPTRWAFLDTETTGLAGGSGTYAFLIGIGRITADGFAVRQYFLREYAEEKSALAAIEAELAEFDVLITYNGRSYDGPLLETRYRMNRRPPPFGRLAHLDLLHGARRLWKLGLESCRLVTLEREILGYLREGDVPGDLIPYLYFDYLRSGYAGRLPAVFHHNVLDILTLACLTAIVPAAFRQTDAVSLRRVGVRRGTELAGLARWLRHAGEAEAALDLLKRAVDAGLPDALLFRTLWDIAALEKKLGRRFEAVRLFVELSECRNEFRVPALEELAKFYEHDQRNYALALDFVEQAIAFAGAQSETLLHRRQRLLDRLARPRARKLTPTPGW